MQAQFFDIALRQSSVSEPIPPIAKQHKFCYVVFFTLQKQVEFISAPNV